MFKTGILAVWVSPLGVMAQAQSQPGIGGLLFPFILIFAFMYFLVIRPGQQQRKRHEKMLVALKPGDRVMTSGGILGTVVGVKDKVIQLRIGDNVRVEVARSHIAGHQSDAGEASKS